MPIQSNWGFVAFSSRTQWQTKCDPGPQNQSYESLEIYTSYKLFIDV